MPRPDQPLSGLRVLFVSSTDYAHRTREFREASSLIAAGADVHMAGYAQEVPDMWRDSSVVVHEFHPLPCPAIASKNKNRLVRIATNLSVNYVRRIFRRLVLVKIDHRKFVQSAAEIRPDVVHAMDLPSLEEAARIARKCRAKLVFDSSEYWRGFLRNKVWDKCSAEKKRYLRAEKTYIHQASLVLTTSRTMSSRLKADYAFDAPAVHLYNAPICSGRYPVPHHVKDSLKVVFHGSVSPDRNLEGLLTALSLVSTSITLDVYGSFVLGMQNVCEQIVDELGLGERVTFHGGFTYGTMRDFLSHYDVGFYPAVATDGNFDVTLPNKVFDCICSGLAVIVPPFDSMKKLMSETDNGLVIDTSSPESMAEGLKNLDENRDRVFAFKKKSCEIAPQYCWEAQGARLVDAYACVLPKKGRRGHDAAQYS